MSKSLMMTLAASLMLSSLSWASTKGADRERTAFKGQTTSALLKEKKKGRKPTRRAPIVAHDIPATSCPQKANRIATNPAWTEKFDRMVAGEGSGAKGSSGKSGRTAL